MPGAVLDLCPAGRYGSVMKKEYETNENVIGGNFMKKLTVKKGAECMACLGCVIACSEAFYKEFDPDKSCIRIGEKNGVVKPATCNQCGKCARTCEHGAIKQNAKGTYVIDKKACVGCGKCVEACPMHVMVMPAGASNPTKCIACGICAKACPADVLEVVES